ncbi:MAG: VCBS repeat-containing protein [Polyangiaceae bacterium]|nr:VCBS repeat-containing protein [Polyangiaceae bacterium]
MNVRSVHIASVTLFGMAGLSCGGGSTPPGRPADAGIVVAIPPAAAMTGEAMVDPPPGPTKSEEMTVASWPLPAAVTEGANGAQKACLAALTKEEKGDVSSPPNSPIVNDMPFRGCFASKGGAWGVVTHVSEYQVVPMLPGLASQQCQEDENCLVEPTQEGHLMYFTDKGKAISGPYIQRVGDGLRDGSLALYDYDGDGTDEVVLLSDEESVYTLKEGKIGFYTAVAKLNFTRVVDADGDAIPDLLLKNPYQQPERGAFGCGRRSGAPLFIPNVDVLAVAHGLPNGTFSTTDAAATERARKVCLMSPVQIVKRNAKGFVDHEATWKNIACARLWGQSETDVRKQLDANCGQFPRDEDTCERLFDVQEDKVFDYCVGRAWTDDWLAVIPPVSIK